MQRYHGSSCTSAVNNSTVGGASARDSSRVDSSSISPNFSVNPRRAIQLTPYKLRCDKEPLNSRLGPPDFHPPSPNCAEETLTREYVQSGYKETIEGVEEAREISHSQVQAFSKPIIVKCKEEIRKCHRAINESRAQKRKAGQVYGVPLSGTLLIKPGLFPEQKACGEEFRKKWIEGLSQPHKRLRSLADHVPHGYRKKFLFEVLIRNNVPLLRATWFIKVTYLNQVRPGSSSISSGSTDNKSQLIRSEHWTKDVTDYLQSLLDEFVSKSNLHSTVHNRDKLIQVVYTGSMQNKSDLALALVDGEEPSLHFKWWYVMRILQWHLGEGLILPSLIIDWILKQLQEKELLGVLQLLLPILYGVVETIVLSQSYVRTLVGVAVRFIQKPSPGGYDLVDNSRRAYTIYALVELLRYLILAVPDTFVALDCFPLPSSVVSHVVNDGSFLLKISETAGNIKNASVEVASVLRDKWLEGQYESLSIKHAVSSIQKCADNLTRASRPAHQGCSMAKAVQALDKTLVQGDLRLACKFLFEDLCDGAVDERWIAEVSPCLLSSLKWIGRVSLSLISSVFLICEWATSETRDFRTAPPHGLKFTGRTDFSQVYIAIRLLKLKTRDIQTILHGKNDTVFQVNGLTKVAGQLNNSHGRASAGNFFELKNNVEAKSRDLSDIFQSAGPLHDIIVCWIDQHELQNEGFKRLQLLILELTRSGIFCPQAYVRQLIVSGTMDRNGTVVDQDRRRRHHKILKQLPGSYICDALGEAQIAQMPVLLEAMRVYSNERRFVLNGLLEHNTNAVTPNSSVPKRKKYPITSMVGVSSPSVDQWRALKSACTTWSHKNGSKVLGLEELKASISILLQLPNHSSGFTDAGLDEYQGSVKRPIGLVSNNFDQGEGTLGCEECRRAKRQKLTGERSSYFHAHSPNPSDDEETWWIRKGQKPLESFKADPPLKQAKQASRGRRKTQSPAQLAAARIEGSQGASTSHVCDSRTSCPHQRPGSDGDTSKLVDGIRTSHGGELVSIGKVIKQLRFLEKRTVTVWLIATLKQLVEESEKTAVKVGQYNRPFSTLDDRCSPKWKLGEDELSVILYLMDVCDDLVSAVRFLLWLLPKVLAGPDSTIHGGRNILILPRNVENNICEVGEAFVLSAIRRYESIIVSADLVPEALSALQRRADAVLALNGRISSSAALMYARQLLTKYGKVGSVIEWEKNIKTTCDKRLLSELESGRLADGEYGFPLGVPAGVENLDDFLRQKITSVRVSRVGLSMKEIVQRYVDEIFHYFYGKERKLFGAGTTKSLSLEKSDDFYHIAQQIVMGLMDCIRQTGGAAQEGDPTLVSSAVCAIVSNMGQVIGKIPDLMANSNHSNFVSSLSSLNFARRMLRVHITCLILLKEALGERQSRVFEIALAVEASSALTPVFGPAKASRSQFQASPEPHDGNASISNEILNNSAKVVLGRTTKVTAAVSALVVGAILHGVATLERMVTVFRLKEGLDVIQFVRSVRSNSNGNARSMGTLKMDNLVEVSVHWFRVLVGNCRTVSDGFIVELLGEASILALSRMQRTLPLSLILPPAFSIFAFVAWKPFILSTGVANRDDLHQLYQYLTVAIGDAVKHLPFRDACLRDTRGFYDLVAADSTDSEFASMLELNGSEMHLKTMAFFPLRARLFLDAIIDCKMPQFTPSKDDVSPIFGHGDPKVQHAEKQTKVLDKLVHVLDTLQASKFHWQWVELRLLLNEQALVEKMEAHDMPLAEAVRSLSPTRDKAGASESENYFTEIILTRLLVRPDAAPLFSEVIHLFGRSLEDSMLLHAKWFLRGSDVLLGRKSIRQRLIEIAESKSLSTKIQFCKPWGWSYCNSDLLKSKGEKQKLEISFLEEGEVVDEGTDTKRYGRAYTQVVGSEGLNADEQNVTEKALVELVLHCLDQSSDESRNIFASDLITQMTNIEQQINALTRGASKQGGTVAAGIEGSANKSSSRKGMRGGSPGLARRPTAQADTVPPAPGALRASMSLRLQFLLRLLPVICADGEPSGRNMRHMLAPVILRLLGSRVVHEDADQFSRPNVNSLSRTEVELSMDASAASVHLSGENLFDRLLLLLHGLLSSWQPSWLKVKSVPKSTTESSRDFAVFDTYMAEKLQNELGRMHLPDSVRWRIQTAMPVLFPSSRLSVSCQPPFVSPAAVASLQPSLLVSGISSGHSNMAPKNQVSLVKTATNVAGKTKAMHLQQDFDTEIDPWILLEDAAGSGPSSGNAAAIGCTDHANLRASSLLKGTVRLRRTDLRYIGAVDDDS